MADCYKWCAIGIQLCRYKASSSGNTCASLCVCWGIIQTQIYNIFLGSGTAFLNALVASSNNLEEIVDCCMHLKTEESHLFQAGLHGMEIGEVMLIHRRWWDFYVASQAVQLYPIVPAVNLDFPDASVHLWDDSSMERFNLLLFWAQVLQKCICLL